MGYCCLVLLPTHTGPVDKKDSRDLNMNVTCVPEKALKVEILINHESLHPRTQVLKNA